MRQARESDDQIALADALTYQGIWFCHVPNEGRHMVQYRVKLKRMGVRPGVPDILIFDPPPRMPYYVGAAIEMKRPKENPSVDQKKWLTALKMRGWYTTVCRGIDEAIQALRELGYLPEVG